MASKDAPDRASFSSGCPISSPSSEIPWL
jgi:hypothetical protein